MIVNAGCVCGLSLPFFLPLSLSFLAGKRQDEGAHEMLMTCQDCLLHFQASSGCLPACLLQLHIYCLILCEREQISTRCAGFIIMNLNINLIYDNLFRKVASLKRESIRGISACLSFNLGSRRIPFQFSFA